MSFSEILDQILIAKGVSNYKLSKDTGISDSLIGYWRNGTKKPSFDNLIALTNYLEVSADYLLTGKEIPKTPELSKDVQDLVSIYDNLDERGKTMVKAKAYEEQDRMGGKSYNEEYGQEIS